MPLGVPLIQYDAPDGKAQRGKPLKERKAFRWIRGLRDCAARRRLATPRNLGLAVRTMAILGGYLYRKNAPPPGHQKIWAGWTRLTIMAEANELKDHFEPPQTAPGKEPRS